MKKPRRIPLGLHPRATEVFLTLRNGAVSPVAVVVREAPRFRVAIWVTTVVALQTSTRVPGKGDRGK